MTQSWHAVQHRVRLVVHIIMGELWYAQGELLKESQLPAPWGPKAHKIEKAVTDKYQPVHYSAKIAA